MRRLCYSPTGTYRFLRLFAELLALAAGGAGGSLEGR